MDKSTISMAIFNSFLCVYRRVTEVTSVQGHVIYTSSRVTLTVTPDGWICGHSTREMQGAIDSRGDDGHVGHVGRGVLVPRWFPGSRAKFSRKKSDIEHDCKT